MNEAKQLPILSRDGPPRPRAMPLASAPRAMGPGAQDPLRARGRHRSVASGKAAVRPVALGRPVAVCAVMGEAGAPAAVQRGSGRPDGWHLGAEPLASVTCEYVIQCGWARKWTLRGLTGADLAVMSPFTVEF